MNCKLLPAGLVQSLYPRTSCRRENMLRNPLYLSMDCFSVIAHEHGFVHYFGTEAEPPSNTRDEPVDKYFQPFVDSRIRPTPSFRFMASENPVDVGDSHHNA